MLNKEEMYIGAFSAASRDSSVAILVAAIAISTYSRTLSRADLNVITACIESHACHISILKGKNDSAKTWVNNSLDVLKARAANKFIDVDNELVQFYDSVVLVMDNIDTDGDLIAAFELPPIMTFTFLCDLIIQSELSVDEIVGVIANITDNAKRLKLDNLEVVSTTVLSLKSRLHKTLQAA
jgi:hypothetical protein